MIDMAADAIFGVQAPFLYHMHVRRSKAMESRSVHRSDKVFEGLSQPKSFPVLIVNEGTSERISLKARLHDPSQYVLLLTPPHVRR